MNMTPIYIGIGVGLTAAIAYGIYRYFTREQIGKEHKKTYIDEADIEKVDSINYETLLKWLKSQYQAGTATSGDSFVIFQNASAAPMFKEIFPEKSTNLEDSKCLAVSVVRDDVVKVAKFYIYDIMATSLSDLLPEDENTTFVQNLS